MLVASAGTVAAVACTVPGTHATIQAAVADPTCDTIDVAPATYVENVTIARPLTLNGPNDGASGAGARGAEANVLSFSITASDVIVDGFSFSNPGPQMNINGTIATILSGVVVQNNIFSGYASVGVPTFNAGNLEITRNLFRLPLAATEAMQIKGASLPGGGCNGTVVSDNVFLAASNNGSADINFSCTLSNSTDVTVSGNTDTGLTAGTSFTAFSGVVDGIVVTDNDVTGTPTAGSAIFFWGGVTGSVDILDNVITDFGGSGISVNNFLEGNNTGTSTFTFNDNDLSGNSRSVYLGNAFDAGAMVAFHRNDLSDNTLNVGAQNDSTSLLADGTCNWWGDASGPLDPIGNPTGTGDAAVGMIDYNPWLTTANLDGPCVGGPLPPTGKATGGGQVSVPGGRGSFGFNARLDEGEATGHLNYRNHVTGAHLNCTVTAFIELSPTTATFSGTCKPQSSADSFTAHVEDHGEPGRNSDVFEITYDGTTEGGTLTAGNIQIGSEPAAAASSTGNDTATARTLTAGRITFE